MKNPDRDREKRVKKNREIHDYICMELWAMRRVLKGMYLASDISEYHRSGKEDGDIEYLLRKIKDLYDLMFDTLLDEKPLSQILKERDFERKAA